MHVACMIEANRHRSELQDECPTCKQNTALPGITIPVVEQDDLVNRSMARFGITARKTTIAALKQCWECYEANAMVMLVPKPTAAASWKHGVALMEKQASSGDDGEPSMWDEYIKKALKVNYPMKQMAQMMKKIGKSGGISGLDASVMGQLNQNFGQFRG